MAMEIIFAEISHEPTPQMADLMKLVPLERQIQLSKFRFDIDRKLSFYSELLVRCRAREQLGLAYQDIVFDRNEYGKPYLQKHPDYHFNISHTRNAIAVVFSTREIGVDIEKIKPLDIKMAERFFTRSEQEYVKKSTNQDWAFYQIWTRKEAYVKYLGKGLSIPVESFDTLNIINAMLYTFEISEYIVSVCSQEKVELQSSLTIMTEDELLNVFVKRFGSLSGGEIPNKMQ